jgi:hypothetical protein
MSGFLFFVLQPEQLIQRCIPDLSTFYVRQKKIWLWVWVVEK